MARRAKPWFRQSDGWWYVYHQGVQTKLAKGEGNKKEAEKVFHALKATDSVEEVAWVRLKTEQCFELFLEHSSLDHAPETYQWYRELLSSAAKSFGPVLVSQLKPLHVTKWLRTKKLGDTSKGKRIGAIKGALNYCVKQGVLPRNPIAAMPRPAQSARDRILTPEEVATILASVRDNTFRLLLEAMYESGARPGEIAKLKPENILVDAGLIVWVRHKTVKKTGKPRVIYMTPRLREIIEERLKVTEPGDFLFKGRKGNPWNKHSFYHRFKYLRKIHPELKGVVPYSFRHSFCTDALEKGIPDATVAELMGHHGTAMIHKFYSKLSKKVDHLKDAATKARG